MNSLSRNDSGAGVTVLERRDDLLRLDEQLTDLGPNRAGSSDIEIFDHRDVRDITEIESFLNRPDEYVGWYRQARRLGITFRYVVSRQVARSPVIAQIVPVLGEQVRWRVLDRVPIRIVSQNGCAMATLDPPGRRRRVVVTQGGAEQAWTHCATELWTQARPWSESAARQAHARTLDVADLLLEGLDDEAVARRLDVSVRTVRRDVADLMAEHGAKSRLQLGAALATTGGT